MKKLKSIALFVSLFVCVATTSAQNIYWVFFTDKAGSTFDPYAYFDAKTIERYQRNNFSLYDISNYPVSRQYLAAISPLIQEEIGQSRWLNAVGVECSEQQASQIAVMPFVSRVVPIDNAKQTLAIHAESEKTAANQEVEAEYLAYQLVRMQGEEFVLAGIDGKGVRIAVFDGGFPRVNTHNAFRHLREKNQIVKTWNFPNRCENVYGWNSHGTMTLSCIAGIANGLEDGVVPYYKTMLGLATGAEFMLARTEVELEPAKEEVWWMEAMEWADAGGANIISSSLGYGKERYNPTEMDGTSLVARAATMAARRGILVCNSAGNEGDDSRWYTIITPADADSVMCVAGIENDLDKYRHIDFSSFGPTADGRRKPNVAAFGNALTADVGNDSCLHHVPGTSFSCPLVAGFAACAWQTNPDLTAMQLFREIERSADLYPYYDYALGYGVPQASYFTQKEKTEQQPTFRFAKIDDTYLVEPLMPGMPATIFNHIHRADGSLVSYDAYYFEKWTADNTLYMEAADLAAGLTWVVWADGYCDSLQSTKDSDGNTPTASRASTTTNDNTTLYSGSQGSRHPSQWGDNSPYSFDIYWQFGSAVNTNGDERTLAGFSTANHLGFRLLRACGKAYRLGMGLEWSMTNYNLVPKAANPLDNALGLNVADIRKKKTKEGNLSLELFQRVRFVAGGQLSGRGIYWDLGIYGSLAYYNYHATSRNTIGNSVADEIDAVYPNPKFNDAYHFNYGITTRFGYSIFALYARYRLTGIGTNDTDLVGVNPTDFYLNLPRLEIGLQIAY